MARSIVFRCRARCRRLPDRTPDRKTRLGRFRPVAAAPFAGRPTACPGRRCAPLPAGANWDEFGPAAILRRHGRTRRRRSCLRLRPLAVGLVAAGQQYADEKKKKTPPRIATRPGRWPTHPKSAILLQACHPRSHPPKQTGIGRKKVRRHVRPAPDIVQVPLVQLVAPANPGPPKSPFAQRGGRDPCADPARAKIPSANTCAKAYRFQPWSLARWICGPDGDRLGRGKQKLMT